MTATVNGVEISTRTGDALQDGIDRLEHLVTEAEAARITARHEADRAVQGAIDLPEVVALRDYHDAQFFRKPGAVDDPARERGSQGALCARVNQDPDLRLTPLGGSRFRIDDHGPQRRLREAEAALREATRCRDEFLREHADEIAAAKHKAEQDKVWESLKSGDPERIREALKFDFGQNAMTTADLQG